MRRIWILMVAIISGACAAPSPVATGPDGSPPGPTEPPAATPDPVPTPWPTPYPKNQAIDTYALLHIWYPGIPETYPKDGPWPAWQLGWVWPPHEDDPYKTMPGAPWMREISSATYPLTGPYDSRNPEILRWQFRQAKAAGLTGFFVPVYSWEPRLTYLDDLFFNVVLPIARETGLKVAIEGWGFCNEADAPRKAQPWKDAIARHLARLETSPHKDAYAYLDGKPMYWIIFPGWMSSRREMLEFFDGTDESPRRVNWVIRVGNKNELFNLNALLRNARLQFVPWYDDPTTKGFRFNSYFAGDISYIHTEGAQQGMVPIAHAYTGYDERMGVGRLDTQRFGERAVIEKFLEDARKAGARIILMESFNENGENSHLEASINIEQWRDMGQERNLFRDEQGNDDPYKYLKIISRFNGMEQWVPPEPPPCSAYDSKMLLRDLLTIAEFLRCRPNPAQRQVDRPEP